MKKMMFFMLVIVGALFGGIFLWKWHEHRLNLAAEHSKSPIFSVSSTTAKDSEWVKEFKVVGSARTVKGVDVTTQLPGMIEKIFFKPGSQVKKGQVLLNLNIAPDIAQLEKLRAEAKIAKITFFRDKNQFRVGGVSQEVLDQAEASYNSTASAVKEQLAIIEKKIIRAPFDGRLGVSLVYPGQYLNPGDDVATLQSLQPIYVDFYLPQGDLPYIKVGQSVTVYLDPESKISFTGRVTTINPIVNDSLRNVEVEATLPNTNESILPGMFAYIVVKSGEPKSILTLPKMAVAFNPYGSIVYTLKKTSKKYKEKTVWQATQQFVETGATRGDQVAITKGVKKGDVVVTAGQIKLKNKDFVVINNSIAVPNSAHPDVPFGQ